MRDLHVTYSVASHITVLHGKFKVYGSFLFDPYMTSHITLNVILLITSSLKTVPIIKRLNLGVFGSISSN